MTAISRSDDVRRQNRRVILAALRRAGRLSRTEICAATGLSASTVSAITSDLIEEGILRQTGDQEAGSARRGRPQIALGLNPDAAVVIAVVLSLNSLTAALIDYSGQVVVEDHRKLSTMTLPLTDLLAETVGIVRRLIEDDGGARRRVLRTVLAVQGITDSLSRSMLWSPITPHSDIAFADALEQALDMPVTVENDCNLIVVALKARDPRRYRDDYIAVLLSHGIGMGMTLKGKTFTGTHSSGAEFGHMIHIPDGALCRCGRRGCVEAYAGNYAIWRNAHGESEDRMPEADIEDSDMVALLEAARSGDGPERRAFLKAGRAIGYSLGNLFALVDPAPVALVGVGASALDLLEGPIRSAIAQTAGGRHESAITVDIFPDEMPLIREGCALQALTFVDSEIFASGQSLAAETRETGKAVA